MRVRLPLAVGERQKVGGGYQPHMTPCRGIQGHRGRTTCCYTPQPRGLTPDFLTLSTWDAWMQHSGRFKPHSVPCSNWWLEPPLLGEAQRCVSPNSTCCGSPTSCTVRSTSKEAILILLQLRPLMRAVGIFNGQVVEAKFFLDLPPVASSGSSGPPRQIGLRVLAPR